jgi:hypothetical protein
VPVQRAHPARLDQLQHALEPVARRLEAEQRRLRHQVGDGRDGPSHVAQGQLVRQRVGHRLDELVRLVQDDRVALGQHGDAGEDVQRQQGVVGHDDVGLLGRLARLLGEAVHPVRALRAQALAGAHRHLPPGPVGHREGHLVAVPVAVDPAHSRSRTTWVPRDDAGPSNRLSDGSSSRAPGPPCTCCRQT